MKVLNIILIVLIWLSVAIMLFGGVTSLFYSFIAVFIVGIIMLIITNKFSKVLRMISIAILSLMTFWCVVFLIDDYKVANNEEPMFAQLKEEDDFHKLYSGFGYKFEHMYEYQHDSNGVAVPVKIEEKTYLFGKLILTVEIKSSLN